MIIYDNNIDFIIYKYNYLFTDYIIILFNKKKLQNNINILIYSYIYNFS